MAIRRAADVLSEHAPAPESFGYSVKNRLLGRPLVNEQLSEQRLSKPLALGVLSPDGISSSAYGTEEILIALLSRAGLAAFALLLPMTLAILFVMSLVVLSYREVVMVYIRPGGSYVVARENFGPRSPNRRRGAADRLCGHRGRADPRRVPRPWSPRSPRSAGTAWPSPIAVILLLCFGNLRGHQGAGRAFAMPTYLFSGSVILDDHRGPGPRGDHAACSLTTRS